MTIFRLILLRMRNVSIKVCRENESKHFVSSSVRLENVDVYENMSKILVELGRSQMKIWRRVACRVNKVTRAHTHGRARAHTTPTTNTRRYL